MDAMEDAVDDTVRRSDQFGAVVKGKRSKRLRMVAVAPATSASSAEISGSTTEEDEDMAHCLILLAQGRGLELGREANPKAGAGEEEEAGGVEKPAVGRKAGDYVYQCKTCSKCFPSFQALGGHRTSHKKPKISPKISLLGESSKAALAEDEAAAAAACSSIPKPTAAATAAPASSNYSSSKPRMHECSICGAEFASGQALGGHMRRHRPLTPAESHPEVKKDKSAFLLDLNLPAPHDDGSQEPSPNSPPPAPAPAVPFSFDTQQSLVFLVDCHY